jgi:hypothetical protein
VRRLLEGLEALFDFGKKAVGNVLGQHHLARCSSSRRSRHDGDISKNWRKVKVATRGDFMSLAEKDCSLIDNRSAAGFGLTCRTCASMLKILRI